MELASLHALAQTEEGLPLWLTYKLLRSREGRYGVLCYVEGKDSSAAALEGLWPRREEAEAMLAFLARRRVAPAHLEDILFEL